MCLSMCFITGDNISRGLSSLIDEEYAFAMTSLNDGIKTAFLSFLSEDAIIFTPDITNGKEWHTNRQISNNILNWKPVFADISVSGELGYTTGPWEFSNGNDPENPVAFGHYVSIWQKGSDNKWEVIVDIGISHSSSKGYDLKNISKENIQRSSNIDMASEQVGEEIFSAFKKSDVEFANLSKSEGYKNAFKTFAGNDVRVYRDEHLPAVGLIDALQLIKNENYQAIWYPDNYGISKSGDLGFTYGTSEYIESGNNKEVTKRSAYLRIWKKVPSGNWQLVLDITNPFPSPDEE